MKISFIIFFQFLFINNFAQKLDKANIDDFTINCSHLIFSDKNISKFEKKSGKLKKVKVEGYEITPFVLTKPDLKLENDKVSLYLKNKKAYIIFYDIEKVKSVLKYKDKFTFSYSSTIKDFKKVFPLSYKNPSYIPATPPEKAVGYTIILKEKNRSSYLNFTFYYNHLVEISLTYKRAKITD